MSGTGQGFFSLQAVLISLAIHVVLVGGLFTMGKSGDDPPAKTETVSSAEEKSPQVSAEKDAEGGMPEKLQDPPPEKPPVTEETVREKPEKPEPVPEKKGPVEIRIEPRRDDVAPGSTPEESVSRETDSPVKTRVYVVKRGDTLTALARECGLTIPELAQLNGKTVKKLSNLKIGQRLKLPVKD